MTRCQEHEVIACPVCNCIPMPLTWLIESAAALRHDHMLRQNFGGKTPAHLQRTNFTRAWTNAIRVQTLKNMRRPLEEAFEQGYRQGATLR